MGFLRNIKKKIYGKKHLERVKEFNVDEVKVAKAIVVTSAGTEFVGTPLCLKCCFLVKEFNGKYYDVFSNKHIGMKSQVGLQYFDIAYIEELEPLTTFLTEPDKKYIKLQDLFDLLLLLNIQARVSDLEKIKI